MPDSLDSDASTYPASGAYLPCFTSLPSCLAPLPFHPLILTRGCMIPKVAYQQHLWVCFCVLFFKFFWFCCFEQSPAPPQML